MFEKKGESEKIDYMFDRGNQKNTIKKCSLGESREDKNQVNICAEKQVGEVSKVMEKRKLEESRT